MVYLMLPDKDDFEVKLGMCDHTQNEDGCVCNVRVKLDTKFRVLERNKCINLRRKNRRYNEYSRYEYSRYDEYSIANSCNGYICLFDTSDRCPPVVCNPITGEFINLPDTEKLDSKYWYNTRYSFGYSPANNQYKVIRMYGHGFGVSNNAEVHILDTSTWKKIGIFTQEMPKLSPAYLNGFLYWCPERLWYISSVFTFDIEKERFGSISTPKLQGGFAYGSVCVGVLGGDLCISTVSKSGEVHIWVMKDREGTIKEWSKVFSSNKYSYPRRYSSAFQPIKYLNDGALLMFHSYRDIVQDSNGALIYINSKRNRFRFLNIHGMDSALEVIAHTPSFVSLKHALSGQNVEVHNFMSSRCNELKLHRKTKDIAIVEDELYFPDTDTDSDFEYSSDSENDIHS